MKRLTVLIILLLMVGYYANVKYKEHKPVINNDIVLIANDEQIDEQNSSDKEPGQYKIESDKSIFETESVALRHATRCGFRVDNIDNVRTTLTTVLIN